MAYGTSARARTARIYRVAVVVVVVCTGNRLPRGSRDMRCRTWRWIGDGSSVAGETLMSLSHWVIEIRSRYACNRASRGVGVEGSGVIDGCHYQLTRSRHHRVGQLIPGLVPLLCGLTSAQVIHWRPRLFIIALVLYMYIYIYVIRN